MERVSEKRLHTLQTIFKGVEENALYEEEKMVARSVLAFMEELKRYREICLFPEKLKEINALFLEKCQEVNCLEAELKNRAFPFSKPEHCLDCSILNREDDCVLQDEKANLAAGESWEKLRQGCPLEVIGDNGWIPLWQDTYPETNDYILLSFENFSVVQVGCYEEDEEGGNFYLGDCDEENSCLSLGLIVNAWQPLPTPYREE